MSEKSPKEVDTVKLRVKDLRIIEKKITDLLAKYGPEGIGNQLDSLLTFSSEAVSPPSEFLIFRKRSKYEMLHIKYAIEVATRPVEQLTKGKVFERDRKRGGFKRIKKQESKDEKSKRDSQD